MALIRETRANRQERFWGLHVGDTWLSWCTRMQVYRRMGSYATHVERYLVQSASCKIIVEKPAGSGRDIMTLPLCAAPLWAWVGGCLKR